MNFLYKIYFALPGFDRFGLIGKGINRVMSFFLKRVLDMIVPSYFKKTMSRQELGINMKLRKEKYIVSLTSFPARIDAIWITIEALLRQSFKPDKIILWLAEEQFPDKILPKTLLQLKERGLTIEFCKDLKAHKKYFYSILNFPESNIITVDDDLYYPDNLLENLSAMHKEFPDLVVTNRAHKITFNGDLMNPYRLWQHNVTEVVPSHLLLATGGAGTLYPPGTLPKETFDEQLFKELCFNADDLWLKALEIKNNTKVVTNRKYNKSFIAIGKTQDLKLVTTNVIQGGNDAQFKNVLNHFKINISNYRE